MTTETTMLIKFVDIVARVVICPKKENEMTGNGCSVLFVEKLK